MGAKELILYLSTPVRSRNLYPESCEGKRRGRSQTITHRSSPKCDAAASHFLRQSHGETERAVQQLGKHALTEL